MNPKILTAFGALILVVLLPFSNAQTKITLGSVSVHQRDDVSADEKIESLISFHEGDTVDESEITDRLSRLQNLGLISSATYKLDRAKKVYNLDITVVPAIKVRDIKVSGNYPVLAKDIKKVVLLQPGSLLDETLLAQTETVIAEYLTKRGYFESEIHITTKKIPGKNVVDLYVKIKKGKTYRLGKVLIEGNTVFSESQIKNKLNHFAHFKPTRLKKDLKRLRAAYTKKGYVKARVKLDGLTYNDANKKVDIRISIHENKKLSFVIEGKALMTKSHLKQVTGLVERRSYDRYAVEDGALRLERFLRKEGYPDARVESEILKPTPQEIVAVYKIDAGRRVEISDIKFTGNHSIGDKKLKKEMKSTESGLFSRAYFDQRQLLLDHIKILDAYKQNGFFDVEIDLPLVDTNKSGDHKRVVFTVVEGEEYKILAVNINADKDVDKEQLIKKSDLKTGKAYEKKKLDQAKNAITDFLQKEGYAYCEVTTITSVDHDKHGVVIDFDIVRGEKTQIRSILVDGNLVTKESVIKKNLKIKPGEPFYMQKMLDGQLSLRRLGIFNSVRISPVGFEEKQENIDLVVSVIERKTVVLSMQGGFDSRHLVTGEFNFTKHNIFGTAKQFNTRLIGGTKYDRAEMTFFSPRVFGATWNLSNQYFGEYEEEPNFADLNYGGFINTLKNFGSRWTVGFKEQVTHTMVFETKSNVAALGNALFDITLNEFQLTGILDLRDNFSDPQKGVYILAKNEIDTDFGNVGNNFDVLEFNINHYQGFFKRFTLVNTFRFGHIFKLSGTPRVPATKLFFLGGADTLRGFSEDAVNPSGGTVTAIYNTELQLRITDSFKVAGFFDAGILGNDINSLDVDNVRESAGMGLRYFTPLGPIRLDWGFILDRQAGEPANRLHFSFGYFF